MAQHLRPEWLNPVMIVVSLVGNAGLIWFLFALFMLCKPKYRRGGLALDGPVGAAILAHRPDAAGLVFQQGQMGAQGFGRRAGQRRALTGAPALMPELLVLALAAAGRVPDDGCFAAAAAHNVVVSKNIQD